MIYGITGSFASVFMLAKGYSNMHIGMMFAAAISAVLVVHSLIQPLLDSLAFRLGESGTDVNYGIGRAGGWILDASGAKALAFAA